MRPIAGMAMTHSIISGVRYCFSSIFCSYKGVVRSVRLATEVARTGVTPSARTGLYLLLGLKNAQVEADELGVSHELAACRILQRVGNAGSDASRGRGHR